MSVNRKLVNAWKILIFLLLVNYQVVVILCNDFFLLKFLRDLVLVYILLQTLSCRPGVVKSYLPMLILLLPCLVWASLRAESLSNAFVNLRKYLFPVGVLIAARMFPSMKETDHEELLGFCANLLALLAAWGIFQAYVLKDTFLIDMGYPTIYANAYKRITLNYSFYFGNLGIQRVTATLSNSNVFGIILGVGIITIIFNHKRMLTQPKHWLRLLCIGMGYVLTVSRSNFLAILIVAVILLWRYIPYKDKLGIAAVVCVIAFAGLYIVQEDTGISHKLVNWVVESFTGEESSAAGRSGIWSTAWNKIRQTPLGLGFGKTGSQAVVSGDVYSCENSYFAMALDMGWLGCISYLLLELSVIYEAYALPASAEHRPQKKLAICVMIYFMIVCCFSNHIYDMEAISYVYFLVGVTSNLLEDLSFKSNLAQCAIIPEE